MSKRQRKNPVPAVRPAPRGAKVALLGASGFVLEDRTAPADFGNSAAIAIPGTGSVGSANPYPSTVAVTGLAGQQITDLQVVFNGLSHEAPDNIDAVLVAPTGQRIVLMSDVGGAGNQPVTGATLTFAASGAPLGEGQISTGTYAPTNLDQGDGDDTPGAPAGALFTSLAQFNGLDPNGTWELRVNDDTVFDTGSMAGGWTLRVESKVNTPPVANADSYTVAEDTPLVTAVGTAPFGVLQNDTDAQNDPLTAELLTAPSKGALTLNANGTFTYTPRTNFNGTDSFTYRASDGPSVSPAATVTITVAAVNDVPVAVDDALTVQNNGPQTIHRAVIVGNDIDPDLTYRSTVYFNDFEGLATQKFSTPVAGGAGADNTDWGELPAGWVRDNKTTPTGAPDEFFGWHAFDIDSWVSQQGDQARSQFLRGGPTTRGTVLVADGDALDDFVDIDSNKYSTLMTTPAIPLDGINADSLRLEFDSSYRPEDPGTSFARVYASFDGGAFVQLSEFNTANTPGGVGSTARINDRLVYELNNPAGAKSVQVRWGYEEAGNDWWWAIDNVAVSGDKTDPSQVAIEIQSQPAQGSVTVDANGAVIYTPPTPGYTGATSFTYRLNDGLATSNTATVSLTVNGNTPAPVAVNDVYSTLQAKTLAIQYDRTVLRNDTDADLGTGNVGLAAALVAAPPAAQGAVAFKADGTFTFTPNPAFFGAATFTYKVSDGASTSNTATVTVNVVQNNFAAPVAVADAYTVVNNGTLTVPAATGVLANDTDADGNPLTAAATKGPNGLVLGPNNGTLAFNADGSFVYVPRPFFNGVDKFTYAVFDGAFTSALATVTLTVTAANVAPQANNDTYGTTAGATLTVAAGKGVLANDRDDGPNVTLFNEGFEGLTLQPFNAGVNGGDGTDYTAALPTGWVRDNTNTPAPATPTSPGAEFFGFQVMDVDSWVAQQGNQARSDFTRGGTGFHGTALVADGDAYTDFVALGSNRINSLMTTPSIPLGTILPNSLQLEFDSSFRPEAPPPTNQYGRAEVSYDDGATWTTLLELTTANSGGASSRSRTNEHIVLDAKNPAGATAAKFRISYLEAGNDWWWAVDNVKAVGSTPNAGAALTAAIVAAPPANEGAVTLNADGSFTFVPASGFTGATSFTYQTSDGVNLSAPATVSIVPVPTVSAVSVNGGAAQRSRVTTLAVEFNSPVAVGAGAFSLRRALTYDGATGDNLTITSAAGGQIAVTTAVVGGKTVATLTFTGTGGVQFGSLADGVWELTVDRTRVTNAAGAMAANFVTPSGGPGSGPGRIFRLYGDFSGDGEVNFVGDYVPFDAAFGSVTGDANYAALFDANADGEINFVGDYVPFDANFGRTM